MGAYKRFFPGMYLANCYTGVILPVIALRK